MAKLNPTTTNPAVVFFGTGPVAAASLKLLAKDFTIEAVITKPRPAHHKGDVPMLTLAEELHLPVFTAANKQELNKLFEARPVRSSLAILIDFGIIVSQSIIDYFEHGIINSHFSLLPEWRGADPITFAVLSGQKQTGISLMLLVEAMDEGPLLAQATYDLSADITTPQLTDALVELSYHALRHIIPLYLSGETKPADQLEISMAPIKEPIYSHKLSKADGNLDWQKPAMQLVREVRAYLGWPRSRTTLGNTAMVITEAHVIDENGTNGVPGALWLEDNQVGVQTSKGIFIIDKLIPAGKKEMSAQAFLAGYKLI